MTIGHHFSISASDRPRAPADFVAPLENLLSNIGEPPPTAGFAQRVTTAEFSRAASP